MYSLEQLQQKNIKELKKIGCQLNVLPAADRRCRQNWIDALVGVNPPLLELLEVSPAVSVEQVQPIIETVETPSAVEVEPVQTLPIESKFCRIVYPRPVQKSIAQAAENSPAVDVDRAQEPIMETVETSPAVSVEQVQEAIELEEPIIEEHFDIEELFQLETADCPACGGISSLYGDWSREYAYGFWTVRCQKCYSNCIVDELPPCLLDEDEDDDADSENSLGVEVDSVEEAIAQAAEIFPGVGIACRKEPLIETVKTSPGVKTEATAIGLAVKNPILTGVTFSDRFLARYAPPQTEIIYFQSDADGQLSLLNFEIESVDEPPDPDDFESLDVFREAIARWDWEHNEVNPEHNDPLQVSLDFFCEWAPCSEDWYEQTVLLEPSTVLELSQTCKTSIASDFFIPTFGCLSDRPNRSDEPPDTGIFVKLPKPKPPSFPPATVGQAPLLTS
jgi:hypothetical protein